MGILIKLHRYLEGLSRFNYIGFLLLRLYLFYVFWNKGTYKIDLVIEGFQSFIQFGPSAANPNVNNNTRKIKKIRVSNAFIVN